MTDDELVLWAWNNVGLLLDPAWARTRKLTELFHCVIGAY